MEYFSLKPNWQPMDTVPKDRPIVIRARSINLNTGYYRHNNYEVYWGKNPWYPDREDYIDWQILGSDGSFMPSDQEFHKEENTGLFRGFQKIAWCEIHEIKHTVSIVGTPDEFFYEQRPMK